MKIKYILDTVEVEESSIFLAGPSFRPEQRKDSSWRDLALKYLKDVDFTGTVYVPEEKKGKRPKDWTFSRQVSWETKALKEANLIVFWIPGDLKELPGFTTNIEFGEWMHSGKIIVGIPDGSEKNRYIIERCIHLKIPVHRILGGCISTAVDIINQTLKPKIFFTSDTHFGEERTRSLSKRPFTSIEQMDEYMLNAWNTKVRDTDRVYHLGDFGDHKMGELLWGDIHFLPGNYDNDKTIWELKSCGFTIHRKSMLFSDDQVKLRMIHHPLEDRGEIKNDEFILFGHIHKLQMVKKNGLNVGVDCHDFAPVSLDDVLFYQNAILNHYDTEVFCE